MQRTPRQKRNALMAQIEAIFSEAEDQCLFYDEFLDGLEEAGIKLADLHAGEYVSLGRFHSLLKRLTKLEEAVHNGTVKAFHADASALRNEIATYIEGSTR